MTEEIAISVDNVSKTFKLPYEKNSTIKGAIINFRRKKKGYKKQVALKNISFEVKRGEFFGIVGRNGSGKSTLLKLISGIYTPDSGAIHVNGKLTPFIELGVGFNPELSGKDNVYLNGSLLGFNRKEMDGMYDEIVAFAELEKFMDQKLKNYSSGMQVRLAFSIAIRANTDILVLDEVLAVGDEAFQRKCKEYFKSLKENGKTVVLVTHSMEDVRQYCDRAVLIEHSKIKSMGNPADIANQYTLDNMPNQPKGKQNEESPKKTEEVRVSLSPPVVDLKLIPRSPLVLTRDQDFEFDIVYKQTDNTPLYVGISVLYENISVLEHNSIGVTPKKINKNTNSLTYKLPLNQFTQGTFKITGAVFKLKDKSLLAFTTQLGSIEIVVTHKDKKMGGLLINRGNWVDK